MTAAHAAYDVEDQVEPSTTYVRLGPAADARRRANTRGLATSKVTAVVGLIGATAAGLDVRPTLLFATVAALAAGGLVRYFPWLWAHTAARKRNS